MTITIKPEPLLALLGDNGERWVQGGWGDGERMCLHGAIRRCSPRPGDAFLIEQVAANQGWGIAWNDDEGTEWVMVRERIIAGIETTDEMLADTFGPQWAAVVALVRRAAVLTPDETQRLAAARAAARTAPRDAVRAAAWTAAWAVAHDAARYAAQDAARDAVRAAAWTAVWAVAWDAAQALVVRDLVGQHGFTQAHYDLLTRPWATVIGPVHPDDKKAF